MKTIEQLANTIAKPAEVIEITPPQEKHDFVSSKSGVRRATGLSKGVPMSQNRCLLIPENRANPRAALRVEGVSSGMRSGNPVKDATVMLAAIEGGDSKAAEQLLVLVYDELRRLAASKI